MSPAAIGYITESELKVRNQKQNIRSDLPAMEVKRVSLLMPMDIGLEEYPHLLQQKGNKWLLFT